MSVTSQNILPAKLLRMVAIRVDSVSSSPFVQNLLKTIMLHSNKSRLADFRLCSFDEWKQVVILIQSVLVIGVVDLVLSYISTTIHWSELEQYKSLRKSQFWSLLEEVSCCYRDTIALDRMAVLISEPLEDCLAKLVQPEESKFTAQETLERGLRAIAQEYETCKSNFLMPLKCDYFCNECDIIEEPVEPRLCPFCNERLVSSIATTCSNVLRCGLVTCEIRFWESRWRVLLCVVEIGPLLWLGIGSLSIFQAVSGWFAKKSRRECPTSVSI